MADPVSGLGGRVRLRVAAGLPAIESSRAELAARLAPGRPLAAWPALVGALFTLCAPAHRLCAERALAAARGAPATATPAQLEALRGATLREQLQRIVHDWPRQLPLEHSLDPQHTARQLRDCPLWRVGVGPGERLAALPGWCTAWLGEPAEQWLQRAADDPHDGIAAWARDRHRSGARAAPRATSLATLLRAMLDGPGPSPLTLVVPDQALHLRDDEMASLANAMTGAPGFCLRPHWHGRPRSTGPWSRRADAAVAPPTTAWHLLVARIADTLRLAAPDGATRLWHGALALPDREGLAWCEMARGLLVHHVRLAPDGRHLEACRVLAPTEWNFHPEGSLAQALAALDARWPAPALDRAARWLAVAFDPCVDFTVQFPDTAATVDERGHCHA